MSPRRSFSCLAALALQALCAAHGTFGPRGPEGDHAAPPQDAGRRLNVSALNARLAFDPYRDLASAGAQPNILFSPLSLASAAALLCRAPGPWDRSRALELLGASAGDSAEDAAAAVIDLLHNLTEGRGGGGAGLEEGGGGSDARSQLKVWSGLHADGKDPDFRSFLSGSQRQGSPGSIDLESPEGLKLNSYAYFKGRLPFGRRHTVPRSFQLNATAKAEVAMMFRDDSSEVMMLYDTNCSATVVQLARSERLAWLLLLPKAELRTLEDCLSDRRMSFWLSNLKPGWAEILFPKFQLRRSYRVEDLLRNSSVFSDLSGLSAKKKTPRLVKASHEVMLEVEEASQEEAGRDNVALDFSVPPRITFNRPFVLIAYDHLTGLVLLMGRISNPAGA